MSEMGDVMIPRDDPGRSLVTRKVEEPPHWGVAGDTYTILLRGEDTAGRYCMIDMHVPRVEGLHRIVMISRRRLRCWRESWSLCFAGRR